VSEQKQKEKTIEFLKTLMTETAKVLNELEKAGPDKPEQAPGGKAWPWDHNKIAWTEHQGPKGAYQKSEDRNSLDFKAMLKDLSEHDGKLSREGLFYWTFDNGATVGRKKASY
jgi:hypothetical protein